MAERMHSTQGRIQKVELGASRGLGDGSAPVGSRGKAPAGSLGDGVWSILVKYRQPEIKAMYHVSCKL